MPRTNQKDQPAFPFEVKSGSVIVKIHKVTNKGRESYTARKVERAPKKA